MRLTLLPAEEVLHQCDQDTEAHGSVERGLRTCSEAWSRNGKHSIPRPTAAQVAASRQSYPAVDGGIQVLLVCSEIPSTRDGKQGK